LWSYVNLCNRTGFLVEWIKAAVTKRTETMKTYTFVIASTSDFRTLQELKDAYRLNIGSDRSVMGIFKVEVDHLTMLPIVLTAEALAYQIGAAKAYHNGWTMKDTHAFIHKDVDDRRRGGW
jgi:hypothetical protein